MRNFIDWRRKLLALLCICLLVLPSLVVAQDADDTTTNSDQQEETTVDESDKDKVDEDGSTKPDDQHSPPWRLAPPPREGDEDRPMPIRRPLTVPAGDQKERPSLFEEKGRPAVMVQWGNLDKEWEGEEAIEYTVTVAGAKIRKPIMIEQGDSPVDEESNSITTKTSVHVDGLILELGKPPRPEMDKEEDEIDEDKSEEDDEIEEEAKEEEAKDETKDEEDETEEEKMEDEKEEDTTLEGQSTDEEEGEEEKEHELVISIVSADGSVDAQLAIKSREDDHKMELGNGHALEVKPLGQQFHRDLGEDKEGELRELKIEFIEKIAEARAELREELSEECRELFESLEDYNFAEVDGLDELKDELKDCRKAKARFESLKPKLKAAKFAQGILRFKDVDDADWHWDFVEAVANRGIFSGFKNADGSATGEYRPGAFITYAQMAKVASEAAGLSDCAADASQFVNLPADHWAVEYFCLIGEVSSSVYPDSVDPEGNITRAQVLQILFDASGTATDATLANPFPDVSEDHPNYAAIVTAADWELVSGDDETGNFRPDAPINRAEVAKIVDLWLE